MSKTYNLETLYTEIIMGVSNKVNKRALNEVIENYIQYQASYSDLNDLLFNYYTRIKSTTSKESYNVEFYTEEDFDNKEDFNSFIKDTYNGLIFKNKYDYKTLGKVKQKDTGLIIGYSRGIREANWCSPGFNVYEYLKVNNIKLTVA